MWIDRKAQGKVRTYNGFAATSMQMDTFVTSGALVPVPKDFKTSGVIRKNILSQIYCQ